MKRSAETRGAGGLFVGESDDHDAFRASARDWVTHSVHPAIADLQREDRPLSRSEWEVAEKAMSVGGMCDDLPRREDDTADWVAVGILLEELARVSTPVAMHVINRLVVPELVAPLLTETQHQAFGHHLRGNGSFAGGFTEPGAGSNPAEMQTVAVRHGDEWIISGRKMWISGATSADVLLLSCKTQSDGEPDGYGLFLVERDRGWTATAIEMLGLSMHPPCEVVLDKIVVPDMARLGSGASALHELQMILSRARCTMAAMSVGIAQGAFDAALDYAGERSQFGRPIAGFQLVQDMLVRMATDIDCGRLLTLRAMHRLQAGTGPIRLETSMAKMFCTEMCVRVASTAIQVHGALGLARESGVERMFRDARMMTIPDGTTEIQKLIIGRELTGINALKN